MGVTEGTVRSHVKALRAKLGARTQLKAVAMLHQAYDATGRWRPRAQAPSGRVRTRATTRVMHAGRDRSGEKVGAGRR